MQIQITAQDNASQVINLVGTAFESAAADIAAMVAKADLAKAAMDALNATEKAVADGLNAAFSTLDIRKFQSSLARMGRALLIPDTIWLLDISVSILARPDGAGARLWQKALIW